MQEIGRVVGVENIKYIIKINKGIKFNIGDFVNISNNTGIIKGLSLDNPDTGLDWNKEESKIFTPDYLDERATFIEVILINDDVGNNEIGDSVRLIDSGEIKKFHIVDEKLRLEYLHLLDDAFKLKILKKIRKFIDDPIIDILIDDIEWKIKI